MTGAELWLLNHISEARLPRQRRFDGIGLVPDDDNDRARLQRSRAVQHVRDHRRAGQPMQDLAPRRFDARAHAGREDHNVDVGHVDRFNYRLTRRA